MISLIIIICYAVSLYSGYLSVAICEMGFAIVFMVVFMMELDKKFQVISWPWSVSITQRNMPVTCHWCVSI